MPSVSIGQRGLEVTNPQADWLDTTVSARIVLLVPTVLQSDLRVGARSCHYRLRWLRQWLADRNVKYRSPVENTTIPEAPAGRLFVVLIPQVINRDVVRGIVCRASSSSEEHCRRIWTVGHHVSCHMPERRT